MTLKSMSNQLQVFLTIYATMLQYFYICLNKILIIQVNYDVNL